MTRAVASRHSAEMTLPEAIQRTLRRRMAALELSTTDMGRRLGISRQAAAEALSRMSSSASGPTVRQLEQWAGALGMPASEILRRAEILRAETDRRITREPAEKRA